MKRGQAVIILLVVIVAAVVALFVLFQGSITGGAVGRNIGRSINVPQTVPVQQVTVPEGPIVSTYHMPSAVQRETQKKPKTVAESCIMQYVVSNDECLNFCEVDKEECQKTPGVDCKTGYDYCRSQCCDGFTYAVKDICMKKGMGVLLE